MKNKNKKLLEIQEQCFCKLGKIQSELKHIWCLFSFLKWNTRHSYVPLHGLLHLTWLWIGSDSCQKLIWLPGENWLVSKLHPSLQIVGEICHTPLGGREQGTEWLHQNPQDNDHHQGQLPVKPLSHDNQHIPKFWGSPVHGTVPRD